MNAEQGFWKKTFPRVRCSDTVSARFVEYDYVMNKKMRIRDLLDLITTTLDEKQIEFALIGGLAVALRGYPRSTVDVDLLVRGSDKDLLKSVLEGAGFSCDHNTAETAHFSGLGFVDCLYAQREISLKMLEDASVLEGSRCKVLQVEDIIGLKIQAYQNEPSRKWKDQADIAELIKANPGLDRKKILEYSKVFDQEEEILAMLDLPGE